MYKLPPLPPPTPPLLTVHLCMFSLITPHSIYFASHCPLPYLPPTHDKTSPTSSFRGDVSDPTVNLLYLGTLLGLRLFCRLRFCFWSCFDRISVCRPSGDTFRFSNFSIVLGLVYPGIVLFLKLNTK